MRRKAAFFVELSGNGWPPQPVTKRDRLGGGPVASKNATILSFYNLNAYEPMPKFELLNSSL